MSNDRTSHQRLNSASQPAAVGLRYASPTPPLSPLRWRLHPRPAFLVAGWPTPLRRLVHAVGGWSLYPSPVPRRRTPVNVTRLTLLFGLGWYRGPPGGRRLSQRYGQQPVLAARRPH